MSSPQTKHYVILKHTTPDGIHWDFMLETGDHLETWRIPIPPEKIRIAPTNAEKIFDHPIKFLTYQGPVNKGKGNVTIEDKGTYAIISKTPELLQIQIKAKILKGNYTLKQTSKKNWQISNQTK